MTTPVEIKDKFYEDLNTVIATVPNAEKLIILGDLNARVDCDSAGWESDWEAWSWQLQLQRTTAPPDLRRA